MTKNQVSLIQNRTTSLWPTLCWPQPAPDETEKRIDPEEGRGGSHYGGISRDDLATLGSSLSANIRGWVNTLKEGIKSNRCRKSVVNLLETAKYWHMARGEDEGGGLWVGRDRNPPLFLSFDNISGRVTREVDDSGSPFSVYCTSMFACQVQLLRR